MNSDLKRFLVWATPYLILIGLALIVCPAISAGGYWAKVVSALVAGVGVKVSQWAARQLSGIPMTVVK